MYESPIDLLMSNIQTQIIEQQEEAIYKAVFDIGVNVTKDELLRALAYDRQQYEIGFAEGIAAKPEWIPVTERLPEEEGLYLVAVVNDHERRYSKTAWYHGHGNWFLHQKVTHWMPLPEPPKEVP